MSFPYPINVSIPNGPNQPRNDQPGMKTNFNNINGFLSVDLVAPGTNVGGKGAGFHKQVTYFNQNLPAAQTDPQSVGFTANASALGGNAQGSASTIVQQFYRNQLGTFHAVPVKAFGFITTPNTRSNTFNVTSITRTGLGIYTVVLATGATNSVNYAILVSASRSAGGLAVFPTYSITNTSTFDLNFNAVSGGNVVFIDPVTFSFSVMQT